LRVIRIVVIGRAIVAIATARHRVVVSIKFRGLACQLHARVEHAFLLDKSVQCGRVLRRQPDTAMGGRPAQIACLERAMDRVAEFGEEDRVADLAKKIEFGIGASSHSREKWSFSIRNGWNSPDGVS
jgi:hypothetical protein